MGFGDPDHPHPLNFHVVGGGEEVTCFRCELPIDRDCLCYACTRCHHFVHELCAKLPRTLSFHPLHHSTQHPLVLVEPSHSPVPEDCSHCGEPCSGKYTYNCPTCPNFILDLRCFLTLNLHRKHHHPLRLCDFGFSAKIHTACRACGLLVEDGFTFACVACKFHIHLECTLLPPTIKHHHVHELTFEHNYPEGSDLAYCDVCEDKDGKELDRSLSYYYCKRCDYIAHVRCATPQPVAGTVQLEHVPHQHPLIYSRKARDIFLPCDACKAVADESFYRCNQCRFILHKSCADFPRSLKHPFHEDHTLALQWLANLSRDFNLCNCCGSPVSANIAALRCLDCDYALDLRCATTFTHPFFEYEFRHELYLKEFKFLASHIAKFRCNACGELGDRYRLSCCNKRDGEQFDIHLECFGLPGKIHHGCHSHPLFAIPSPTMMASHVSTTYRCDICGSEFDPNLWVYCCEQCQFIAHLKCVAGDLLSANRVLNNKSDLCSIPKCKTKLTKPYQSLCSRLSTRQYSPNSFPTPVFFLIDSATQRGLSVEDRSNQPKIKDVTGLEETFNTDVLQCPKCERPIFTKAHSCILDWAENNCDVSTIHDQTSTDNEPLTRLDEKLLDELCCPICNLPIFPPTYSCTECQIFFHKSCAELPRKQTIDPVHTFVLVPPPSFGCRSPNCAYCEHPIEGYAYACRSCGNTLDIPCTLGAPILNTSNHGQHLYSRLARTNTCCRACREDITKGTVCVMCGYPSFIHLHIECATLPHMVCHRIHKHPLELDPNLQFGEYYCDVCEKGLNPRLWAYRCSDSCGDRATSHVSCIVTSNKKHHFVYDKECQGVFLG